MSGKKNPSLCADLGNSDTDLKMIFSPPKMLVMWVRISFLHLNISNNV